MVTLARPQPPRAFRTRLGGAPILGYVGPNWFAAVMGTGIVANAAATLPVHVPGLLVLARTVWVLDAALLVVVSVATGLHWLHHREVARGHLSNPVLAPFYGAPAMALLTVGAGAVLVGTPVIGEPGAVAVDASLWVAGTALGLWTAVALPYHAFTSHVVPPDAASGGWLMPVVPPMVSAATGPLLLPHLPAGQWRLSMLLACLMMFGLTLVASLVVLTLLWDRLVHHKVGAAAAVPTLWIVLGPVGQSITASHTIGVTAPGVLPGPVGAILSAGSVAYGVPALGFGLLWMALALSVTVRTARQGLPFSLTWWSFTFPVGTMVTGTSALALATGSVALQVLAVGFYVALVGAWALVATRTVHGIISGGLLLAPVPQ